MSDDVIRLLAVWALVHEMADEGWKAAVARGRDAGVQGMDAGPDALTDGVSAMVAQEKERLKESLAAGTGGTPGADATEALEGIRFEIGELRGRLEAMEASLDAIKAKLGPGT